MHVMVASHIMSRTTLNIDDAVLDELKNLSKAEERSLGQLASELLAQAISARRSASASRTSDFVWRVKSMGARVDLEDKDALARLLDES
ncbi:MAG: antitoxin [Acidobacteria bacterium]|nr:MAG: antitoxin [Acidobacteriota bacterium]